MFIIASIHFDQLVFLDFTFLKSFFRKTMFSRIQWIWGIVLIGTITAERNDLSTHCSAGDAKQVQREWRGFWRACDSDTKIALAKNGVLQVVGKHPEAKILFQNVGIDDPDSGEFGAQCLRIFNYFDFFVNLLHDKEALREASANLGHQHAAMPGMLATYFKSYISYVLGILSQYDYRFHGTAWESCLNDMLKGVFEACLSNHNKMLNITN